MEEERAVLKGIGLANSARTKSVEYVNAAEETFVSTRLSSILQEGKY